MAWGGLVLGVLVLAAAVAFRKPGPPSFPPRPAPSPESVAALKEHYRRLTDLEAWNAKSFRKMSPEERARWIAAHPHLSAPEKEALIRSAEARDQAFQEFVGRTEADFAQFERRLEGSSSAAATNADGQDPERATAKVSVRVELAAAEILPLQPLTARFVVEVSAGSVRLGDDFPLSLSVREPGASTFREVSFDPPVQVPGAPGAVASELAAGSSAVLHTDLLFAAGYQFATQSALPGTHRLKVRYVGPGKGDPGEAEIDFVVRGPGGVDFQVFQALVGKGQVAFLGPKGTILASPESTPAQVLLDLERLAGRFPTSGYAHDLRAALLRHALAVRGAKDNTVWEGVDAERILTAVLPPLQASSGGRPWARAEVILLLAEEASTRESASALGPPLQTFLSVCPGDVRVPQIREVLRR